MVSWINDSNKYEEIWKAYFGSYEITIFKLKDSDYIAYTRTIGGTSLCRYTYNSEYTIEKVKEKYIKDLTEFLDKRVTYWMRIQHDLWNEVQQFDQENN